MLQKIINILNSPAVVSVDVLAEQLNCDTQSVRAALDILKRMGYISDMRDQVCSNSTCTNGKSCGGCESCTGMNNTAMHIYSLQKRRT